MSELCEVVELCQNWFLKLAVSVFQNIRRSVSNAQARSQLKIQMVGASNREHYVSVYASYSSDICLCTLRRKSIWCRVVSRKPVNS